MSKGDDEFYQFANKSIRLINPYIQVISISKYTEESNGKFKDLPGCNIDRKNMIHLWKDIYKFDENRIFYNDESGIILNKQYLNGILLKLKAKMTIDNIDKSINNNTNINNNNQGEYNRTHYNIIGRVYMFVYYTICNLGVCIILINNINVC